MFIFKVSVRAGTQECSIERIIDTILELYRCWEPVNQTGTTVWCARVVWSQVAERSTEMCDYGRVYIEVRKRDIVSK